MSTSIQTSASITSIVEVMMLVVMFGLIFSLLKEVTRKSSDKDGDKKKYLPSSQDGTNGTNGTNGGYDMLIPRGKDLEGEELMSFIRKMPFMPEPGVPIPEYVMKTLYPSPAWDLMKPPVSGYGGVVVEETAKSLKEFMSGGGFVLKEKFDESGWSSEDITYTGYLIHVPTKTSYLAEIYVVFEWRKPEKVEARLMSLWVGDPEDPEQVWDGDLDYKGGENASKVISARS